MLDTGRMPAPARGVNEIHRIQRFTDPQITALVDYVLTFTPGADRALPVLMPGNVYRGRELFAENCAPCHGASGDGASVGENNVAPSFERGYDVPSGGSHPGRSGCDAALSQMTCLPVKT